MSLHSGLGIRPEFVNQVLQEKPQLAFLEAHSENYFGESLNREKLLQLGDNYPLSLHGVGLSLGRADALDINHLKELKRLVDDTQPLLVSEHLAWSAYAHRHIPDLLPLPLSDQSLTLMCEHVDQMQQTLGRQVLIENPSNYVVFDQLQIPEPEFLNQLASQTGCGLLVDVNNIYVSSVNLGRSALRYLQALDSTFVSQYHLAGHSQVERDLAGKTETLLIDTHNQRVNVDVWALFARAIEYHGVKPTLCEWDSDFPEFDVLLDECRKADTFLQDSCKTDFSCNKNVNLGDPHALNTQNDQGDVINTKSEKTCDDRTGLARIQTEFLDDLISLNSQHRGLDYKHLNRISIYQNNAYSAIQSYMGDVYPAVKGVVGADFFDQMVRLLLQHKAPSEGNIHQYGEELITTIDSIEGLQGLPYLADLMRFEWALHFAYYCDIGDEIDLNVVPEQTLLNTQLRFNASVQIIASTFPIYEIYQQSLPSYAGVVSISLAQSQDTLLVYKRQSKVEMKLLSDTFFAMFQEIEKTQNLMQAIETLSGAIEAAELSDSLGFMFKQGLLRVA